MEDSLADRFRRHARAPASSPALAATLAELVTAARAAWPALALPATELARHLAQLWDGVTPVDDWLRARHAADLYVACGCALGHDDALAAFDAGWLARVGQHLAQLRVDAAFVDDVRQELRQKLLVAPAGQAPRIAEYAGHGPLDGWLRVAAMRVALDLRRRRQPLPDGGAAADEARAPAGDPERGYVENRYRTLLQECLTQAVQALPPELRNLLRMHIVDGLTLEQLAPLMRASRATVVRRLATARAQVVEAMRARVQARLPLGDDELESLMGQLVSQLDLSLSTVV